MPDVASKGVCAFCGKPGTKRCGGCRSTWYCSTACQRTCWPEHKGVCEVIATESKAPIGDASLAAFVAQRKKQEKEQEKNREKMKDKVTELLSGLITKPRDPEIHFELAYLYAALFRQAEAVQTLGQAMTYLLTTHPSAEMELDILRRAPPLLESALLGRGEADWLAEESVAQQLIEFVERVVPLHAPTAANALTLHSSMSCARRALAGYHSRTKKHKECVAQLTLADECMRPLRDLEALKKIPDEESTLAHAADASATRAAHMKSAIRAARENLSAVQAGLNAGMADRQQLVEAKMLLARMLFTSLAIPAAPAKGAKESATPEEALPAEAWAESVRACDIDDIMLEARSVAEQVCAEGEPLGMRVIVQMAQMLLERLEGAASNAKRTAAVTVA